MDSNIENRRRPRLGLLISHLEDEFDNSVCEGAMIAAQLHDTDLVVLPGRYIDAVYADKIRTEYEYQYNTVFDLADLGGFDALLLLIGTIGSHLDKEKRKKFIERFANIPVITLASRVEGCSSITIDNRTGLTQIIEHLICDHKCQRIGFVTGPMTSDDAVERFEVYKNVLKKHDIAYDEDRVAYGNFSKYVEEEVEALLDRCPDLEAIVFSNDQMAVGGYKVLSRRGLTPGTDILVTGFDNDSAATELHPSLTTVAMDSTELGYNAVIEAINLIRNGSMERDILSSSMITRSSCGCTGKAGSEDIGTDTSPEKVRQFAVKISRKIFCKYRLSELTVNYRVYFVEFITELADISKRISQGKDYDPVKVFMLMEKMIDRNFFDHVDLDNLYSVIESMHCSLSACLTNASQLFSLNGIFVRIYKGIAEMNEKVCRKKLEQDHYLTWHTNSITRDMLIFDAYDDKAYQSVIDKMVRLHIKSSFLYVYEPKIINTKNDVWKYPEKLKLKAYHVSDSAKLVPAKEQDINTTEIFSHERMPKDRRVTLICLPIFSNDEHYGLLVCEAEHKYLIYLHSITAQLSAALKIISLMQQQTVIQKQLKQSLLEIRENNQLLGELSRLDELTGCYNRRGFFDGVRKLIRSEANAGKDAVMIFADLDDLKSINDRFGHEEGDFAIVGISKILADAFNGRGITGRIGGDEFVICMLSEKGLTAKDIRREVDGITADFNKKNCKNKGYTVHASIGVYPFKCSENAEINELLSHADSLLYEQKKKKPPTIKN